MQASPKAQNSASAAPGEQGIEDRLVRACELVGTPELLAKIGKKRGLGSQTGTSSRAQLLTFSQTVFKTQGVRPVIVQLLDRVFRDRFRLASVRSIQLRSLQQFQAEAKREIFQLAQDCVTQVSPAVEYRAKYFLSISEAKARLLQNSELGQTQSQVIRQIQVPTYVTLPTAPKQDKYAAFAIFKRKIDATGYYYEDRRTDEHI